MGFNEKTHAFIAAMYYKHLVEDFGERGRKAFVHGTQYYAEQRGRRMAQRAIKDGEELTYATYLRYGEWVNTDEIKAENAANQAELQSIAPHFVNHIFRCPWHEQFKELGMTEAGHEYCKHLDSSICRGFNPYITFQVEQTLHKSDYCIHKILDTNYDALPDMTKKQEYLKSFEYHCGHSYWAYREVSAAIFGEEGEAVALKVLENFAAAYGQEMKKVLLEYENTNFNVC